LRVTALCALASH